MANDWLYANRIIQLPTEVQKAIRSLEYEKRQRMIVLADLGVPLTLEHVEEMRTLKGRGDIDRFARKLIFSY